MSTVFHYEDLTADFNRKLVTQLRHHGTSSQYLETWVPDEDPVRSILNMVESAFSAGCGELRVRFAAATMDEPQRRVLVSAVSEIGLASLAPAIGGFELAVRSKDRP